MKYINKISIFFVLLVTMCASAFALDLQTDQTANLQDFFANDKGNQHIFNGVGNINNVLETGNGTNYTYDFVLEFADINEDFYFIINNPQANNHLQLLWQGDLTRDPTLYIQDLVMEETGDYYFKFEKEYSNEAGFVYIEYVNDSFASTHNYIELKPQTFNALIGGLVESFQEIISMNVQLWKLAFYTLILFVTLGVIGVIFGIAFYMFNKARELKEKKITPDNYIYSQDDKGRK